MSESTRIFASNYRKSLASNIEQMITVQVALLVAYQSLVQLGLEVKIVKIGKGEIEISLEQALSCDQEVNLELQILNLAESEVLTQKGWNDLIESWGGKIERS